MWLPHPGLQADEEQDWLHLGIEAFDMGRNSSKTFLALFFIMAQNGRITINAQRNATIVRCDDIGAWPAVALKPMLID